MLDKSVTVAMLVYNTRIRTVQNAGYGGAAL